MDLERLAGAAKSDWAVAEHAQLARQILLQHGMVKFLVLLGLLFGAEADVTLLHVVTHRSVSRNR